jgi:hypothetical protein
MLGDVLDASRYGALAFLIGVLILGMLALVALLRCRREDLPRIVEALGSWWRRK